MPNDSLIHADIFFLITTISVVIIASILATILIYGAKIARNISQISDEVKKESGHIIKDFETARVNLKENGLKFSYFTSFIKNFFGKMPPSVKKKTSHKNKENPDN